MAWTPYLSILYLNTELHTVSGNTMERQTDKTPYMGIKGTHTGRRELLTARTPAIAYASGLTCIILDLHRS